MSLNELYWQRGRRDRYAASYARAVRAGALSTDLAVAWARNLTLAGREEEADVVLGDALAALGEAPELLRWRARLARRRGEYAAAAGHLERAVALDDERRDAAGKRGAQVAQDLVEVLLLTGDLERADAVLDTLLARDRLDQLSWALRGTTWRLMEDARYGWLCDFDRFVHPARLPVPAGYASLEAFLEELAATLGEMHRFDVQPLEQTLNLGSQTPGRLLQRPEPVIRALRDAMAEVVRDFIGALGHDAEHPFLGRNTGDFRFSGSWSVRLVPGGFHVDHVHPAGWISSSCYVSVPASVDAQDETHAGWIRFGRSSLALGPRDAPERFVRPESGMLVLFPSYTWHGTVPFEGNPGEFRMTAPFDAVPA